jgi:hypothetical protein
LAPFETLPDFQLALATRFVFDSFRNSFVFIQNCSPVFLHYFSSHGHNGSKLCQRHYKFHFSLSTAIPSRKRNEVKFIGHEKSFRAKKPQKL